MDHPQADDAWTADQTVDASGQEPGRPGEQPRDAGNGVTGTGPARDVGQPRDEDERAGGHAGDASDRRRDASERGSVEDDRSEAAQDEAGERVARRSTEVEQRVLSHVLFVHPVGVESYERPTHPETVGSTQDADDDEDEQFGSGDAGHVGDGRGDDGSVRDQSTHLLPL